MACLVGHDWGWPRKRGERDFQTCSRCGAERLARVQFAKSLSGLRVATQRVPGHEPEFATTAHAYAAVRRA